MRVLIINTSERIGGAAIAANRLMESLNDAGIDTGMLVLHKTSHSDKVHTVGKSWQRKFTFIWERLIIWANNLFSRKSEKLDKWEQDFYKNNRNLIDLKNKVSERSEEEMAELRELFGLNK